MVVILVLLLRTFILSPQALSTSLLVATAVIKRSKTRRKLLSKVAIIVVEAGGRL